MTTQYTVQEDHGPGISKHETGIPGLDFVCNGGLPTGRVALVCGGAGTGKTVLALQFLVSGARSGEPGVFVTFEESPESVRANVRGFGWDIAEYERQGLWTFVDGSRRSDVAAVETGAFDLEGLIARIRHAVGRIGARRVALDSLGAAVTQFTNIRGLRPHVFGLAARLNEMNVTTMLTAEESTLGQDHSLGFEEYVADTVVTLRNELDDERRRRTLEVLKMRGSSHMSGEYPFTIVSGRGAVVIPLSALELGMPSGLERISSGVPELDAMCGGGFFRDAVVLVSGATGTGKTLLVTSFMAGGARAGERSALLGFEESPDQLRRNAFGWGHDFEALEAAGNLLIHCEYPERASLENTLLRVERLLDEYQPQRIAIDSMSALERSVQGRSFREFVLALTAVLKQRQIACMMTTTTPNLLGGSSITETHISTLTDSIILLRYVELQGQVERGLTVLKMRGSQHDKGIRAFSIDGAGMHVGAPFPNVFGILAGNLRPLPPDPAHRVSTMFDN